MHALRRLVFWYFAQSFVIGGLYVAALVATVLGYITIAQWNLASSQMWDFFDWWAALGFSLVDVGDLGIARADVEDVNNLERFAYILTEDGWDDFDWSSANAV